MDATVANIFTVEEKIAAMRAMATFLGSLGIIGVGIGISHAVIGMSNSSEVRVDMVGCVTSISAICSGVLFTVISLIALINEKGKTMTKFLMLMGGGAVLSVFIYTGAVALGINAKYGIPSRVRQKKFSTIFFVNLAVSELISMFGMILFFVISTTSV